MSFLGPPTAQARRNRILIGVGAVAATTLIMVAFLVESRWGYMKPDPKLIYVQSWKADRSREDAIADAKATQAAREAALAQSRAYIATLSGKAREDAQKQYDAYVNGNGAAKDIPYVAAAPDRAAAAPLVTVPAEPPVE